MNSLLSITLGLFAIADLICTDPFPPTTIGPNGRPIMVVPLRPPAPAPAPAPAPPPPVLLPEPEPDDANRTRENCCIEGELNEERANSEQVEIERIETSMQSCSTSTIRNGVRVVTETFRDVILVVDVRFTQMFTVKDDVCCIGFVCVDEVTQINNVPIDTAAARVASNVHRGACMAITIIA